MSITMARPVALASGPVAAPRAEIPWTLTAVTPPHEAGRVDVVVTNPDGQSGTSVLGYEYSDLCTNCATPIKICND